MRTSEMKAYIFTVRKIGCRLYYTPAYQAISIARIFRAEMQSILVQKPDDQFLVIALFRVISLLH